MTTTTDVVVIGSGFGAAAAALRLARAGLKVRMLEKGAAIGPGGYRQTQDPAYLTKYLKGVSGEHVHLTYAEALGGGSGFYEMVSLRAPTQAFEQTDPDGRRLWPRGLTRAALDPWYDLAEEMLRVEQIPIEEVPRTGLVFSLLMKNLGYTCDRARYAVRNCLGSGFCITGCLYGAKQSLHLNYLPQAAEAGAEVTCGLEAVGIEPIGNRYRVRCRPTEGEGPEQTFDCRVLVLGGGTVGTAALLLASRRRLPRLSPTLGRHIAINGSVKVAALLPDGVPDGDMFTGRSHPGMISYHFLDSHRLTVSAVKALPIQAVTAARFRLDGDPREPSWWGEANADLMRQFRHRMIALASFGLTPPCAELALGDDGQPRVALRPTQALEEHYRSARALLESILTRNGCRLVRTDWLDRSGWPRDGLFFSTAHQTGSARMAENSAYGVVDRDGEVFGYPGLFVVDGAAVPSSLAVNTSLTILANAERIAAGMVGRYGLLGP